MCYTTYFFSVLYIIFNVFHLKTKLRNFWNCNVQKILMNILITFERKMTKIIRANKVKLRIRYTLCKLCEFGSIWAKLRYLSTKPLGSILIFIFLRLPGEGRACLLNITKKNIEFLERRMCTHSRLVIYYVMLINANLHINLLNYLLFHKIPRLIKKNL